MVDILLFENNLSLNSHSYNVLIYDYRYLILSFKEAILKHVHRDDNFCANLLLKAMNNLLDVFSEFIFTPYFVISQLLTDIWMFPCFM